MSTNISRRSVQKRERILDAARGLFLANGVRATTMEAIAREAGIAKATLYAQFDDKLAILSELVGLLVGEKRAAVEAALAGGGTGLMRAANALAAKHKLVARLLEGSPHGEELEAEGRRYEAAHADPFDVWLLARITDALAGDGIDNPQQSARLLIACADGIALHASHSSEIGPAIRLVAERLFGGANV